MFYAYYVLYVGKKCAAPIYPYLPHSTTPLTLANSPSLPPFLPWVLSLALVLRAVREVLWREQTHWDIYTRNITAADSRRAALVREGSLCAILSATGRERKKRLDCDKEKGKETSEVFYLISILRS